MRERYELALKIACAVLAAVLLVQTGRALFRKNPVKNLKIPALPVLAAASDSATNAQPPNAGAGATGAKGKTNRADSASKNTNAAPLLAGEKAQTNSLAIPNAEKRGTNSVTRRE